MKPFIIRIYSFALIIVMYFLPPGCSYIEKQIPGDTEKAGLSDSGGTAIEDAMFSHPYIDKEEWRDTPYRHLYVHGGFKDTDTRFSFYFPPSEQYEGRFFQYITPVPDSENLSEGVSGEEDRIGFSIHNGAYFVATNGGGKDGSAMPYNDIDPTIGSYRANAAAAQYSRVVAVKMYGGKRPYGYAFGGSGGGYRTIAGIENAKGVWDGVVPYVIGSTMSIPNVFTVRAYAMRVLGDKLPDLADAVDVGSNRNPFSDIGLNAEQRTALAEVARMGFPLSSWHAYEVLDLHAFALLFPAIVMADPPYFKDFWTKPGYEGYEPSASLKASLIDMGAAIEKIIMVDEAVEMGLIKGSDGDQKGLADQGWRAMLGKRDASVPVGVQLSDVPKKNALGSDLIAVSGDAAGKPLPMAGIVNNIVLFNPGREAVVSSLKSGDRVHFNNKNFLAVQTYHRHQVPGRDFKVWDQFRDDNGHPIYPQRPSLFGPVFARSATAETLQNGVFKGKMIVIENLYDTEAFPWQADWYRNRVAKNLGPELENNFRLWFTDRANHSDISRQKQPTHTISFIGVIQQALLDLSAWVEKGVVPPASTVYEIVDGQVVVPDTASKRLGIQPVVTVTANESERCEVAVGEVIKLKAEIEVPPGTGQVVSAKWDLNGKGEFPIAGEIISNGSQKAIVKLTHTYDAPGTYFPTLRAASHRLGDKQTPYAQVRNLGRVRVIVTK